MSPSPTHRTTAQARTARTRKILIGAGIGAVAVAVLIAVLLGAEDDQPVASDGDAVEVADSVRLTGSPLPRLADTGIDAAVGMPAPALSGVGPDGSPVSAEPGGDPLLLIFAAHWCPHCQQEVPRIAGPLAGDLPGGAEVVLVSTGQVEERGNWPPSEWLAGEGWTQPVLVDDGAATAGAAYGLSGYPYFVMVDAEGLVTERASGALGPDAVLAMIERAVAQ